MTSTVDWTRTAGKDNLPPGRPYAWAGGAERERTLGDAFYQAERDLAELGWSAEHRILDSLEPTAAQCRLHAAGGSDVPYGIGAGKGGSRVAYVGAVFEAIEHALSGPTLLGALPIVPRAVPDIESAAWNGDRALDLVRDGDGLLGCLLYDEMDGGPEQHLPLALWSPWYVSTAPAMAQRRSHLGDNYNYASLRGYSNNTGCAIGATRDEALLHGLNEWVERDALSLFLLVSVYDGGPMPPVIDPSRLPSATASLLAAVESRFGQRVHLLDLTSDIGVPVVMAYLVESPGLVGPRYGMGASLSVPTALERAITELVQGELLAQVVTQRDAEADHAGKNSRADALQPSYERVIAEHDIAPAVRARLAPHPRLLACAQLAISDRLDTAHVTAGPLDCVTEGTSVAQQRQIAVERISSVGCRVLATTLASLPHGTTVVQVQCPGLERFHLITKGHLALPGARGRRARQRPLP